jgi:mRNA interferase MazF
VRRGDIWLVDFEPTRGSEAARPRPAVIVGNDGANTAAGLSPGGVVTVVPLTTNTQHVYPFQALLEPQDTGLGELSKAQAEQVRSVSVARLIKQVGSVPRSRMAGLDDALRLHLAL